MGVSLLERVEEDAVCAEAAHRRGELLSIISRTSGARVPRVVVEEHGDSGGAQCGCGVCQAVHVVEVPLIAIIDPDHRVGVPEHDAVESAEAEAGVVEESLRCELLGVEVEEQLVPQPHLRHGEAAVRPARRGVVVPVRCSVAASSTVAPRRELSAPLGDVGRV